MNKPAVSIIMPVYNAAPFLPTTLDAILAQTFSDFELICINDGSTDDSLQILEAYQGKFRRPIQIISQENRGPGIARNRGLAVAQGEYLAILDADDIYEPEFLAAMYEEITRAESDLVVIRSDELHQDTQELIPTPWTINDFLCPSHRPFAGTEIPKNAFEVFVGWPWDKLFRADFIKKHHLTFPDLHSSEDAPFCFMAILLANRISIVDRVAVHHRKVAGSVSTTRETNWGSFYDALLLIRRDLKKHHLYQRFKPDFINYALNFSLWHLTTLTGDAYFKLYDKLKNEWWSELGVQEHPKEYFYSPYHYQMYTRVQALSALDFLFYLRDAKTSEVEARDRELAQLRAENATLTDELEAKRQEISTLYASTSWKLGNTIVRPIHRLKQIGCSKAKNSNPDA